MARFDDTTLGGKNVQFPQTRWTFVLKARDKDSPEYRENLDTLLSLYWKPVYHYIRIFWNMSREEAKDLTQEFFLSLLERESLEDVTPEKGKFRHFIKGALKNFLMNYKRDQKRIKRGGGKRNLSFDLDLPPEDALSIGISESPDRIFYQEWARTVMDRAVQRMEDHFKEKGKALYFRVFQIYYLEDRKDRPKYDDVGRDLNLSAFDVGNYLKASRKAFRTSLKEVISEYVDGKEAIEEEFQELMGVLIHGK